MRLIIAVLTLAIALTLAPAAAQAAPAEQSCGYNTVNVRDMAGTYVSPEHQMRVEVYPCGGVYVQWDNAYGTHAAAYISDSRAPRGGVVAQLSSGTALDDSRRLAVKPAETGYVQIITLGVYDDTFRVYRLRKIA